MSTISTHRPRRLVSLPEPARDSPELDYVEFFRAGAEVRGWFSCTECERLVESVRQLPDCPACGGRLWEQATPRHVFGEADVFAWQQELDDYADFRRGVATLFVFGALSWFVLAVLAVGVLLVVKA